MPFPPARDSRYCFATASTRARPRLAIPSYFEAAYPIAQNNRIVIPMGSFVRGKILESKRPSAYIGTLAGTVANGAPVKSALIGGGAGAAAGLIAILLTRGPEAELPRGTMLDVVFDHALILDVDHLPANDPGRLSQPLGPVNSQQETHRRERPQSRTLPGWPFPFLHF